MQIDATSDGSHLVVAITFVNPLDETVYLKNFIKDWFGLLGIPKMNARESPKTAIPTRELAYACVGAHGELVLLSGDGPSLPSYVLPNQPSRPFATRLAKGETYRGSVRLPLPICEWHAHEIPATAPTVAVEVTELRYRLELLRESVCKQPVRELTNLKGMYAAHGYPSEFYEAKTRLARPITVLKRTDAIERFA